MASAPEVVIATLARKLAVDVVSGAHSAPEALVTLREPQPNIVSIRPRIPLTWDLLNPLAEAINAAVIDDGSQLNTARVGEAVSKLLTVKRGGEGASFLDTGQRLVVFLQLDGDVENPER